MSRRSPRIPRQLIGDKSLVSLVPCYTSTMTDQSRQDAASPDDYTLTIEEAARRYEHAGHPRTIRSIQRYCAKGHLDCLRQETTFGDKYLITAGSVARHIAQIAELASTTSRDMPRNIATPVAVPLQPETPKEIVTTVDDQSRQDATRRDVPVEPKPDTRYVEQLERENGFLREQITVKDAQISELGVRARETNVLIKGLQDLFLALNPGRSEPRTHRSSETATPSGGQPEQAQN